MHFIYRHSANFVMLSDITYHLKSIKVPKKTKKKQETSQKMSPHKENPMSTFPRTSSVYLSQVSSDTLLIYTPHIQLYPPFSTFFYPL